jgi:DNA-directed RNA polymerase subunit RPC12/RpoP
MYKSYNCHLCHTEFDAIPYEMISENMMGFNRFIEVICFHCGGKYILDSDTMKVVTSDFKGNFIIQEVE